MQAWTEGETAPRQFTLWADDDTTQNLAGCTVVLILTAADGTDLDTTGDLVVTSAGTGVVTYAPKPAHIVSSNSPMTATFQVTDPGGYVGFFPGDGADEWEVYPARTAHPRFTFGDLRTQVLRWLDGFPDFNTGSTLDLLVAQQVNEAHVARCSEYPWPFLRVDYNLAVTGASRRYTLPGNVGRLLYLWSPTDNRYCTRVPDRHLDEQGVRFDGVANADLYRPFELRGSTLYFFENPIDDDLLVGYFKSPQKLINLTDIPTIPYPHSRLLVWDALLDLKSYATELSAGPLWERKQQEAEHKLYAAYVEGQTLGGVPLSIRQGSGNF
jgi:hypothetical protein